MKEGEFWASLSFAGGRVRRCFDDVVIQALVLSAAV